MLKRFSTHVKKKKKKTKNSSASAVQSAFTVWTTFWYICNTVNGNHREISGTVSFPLMCAIYYSVKTQESKGRKQNVMAQNSSEKRIITLLLNHKKTTCKCLNYHHVCLQNLSVQTKRLM